MYLHDYEPIEGADYIFDRYAYLGLTPAATNRDIQLAVRGKRAGVHDDRLVNVDERVMNEARRIRALVDTCAEILLNDKLRPLYDERLAWFTENKPDLVSKDGIPIVSMNSERMHIDFLLKKDNLDLTDMMKQAQAMTGYSPKILERSRKRYESDPEDADNQDEYREVLQAKWVYLCLLESFAWAKAGVVTGKSDEVGFIHDAKDYIAAVEQQITKRHEAIREAIAVRSNAIQIGMAKPPLLLSDMRGKDDTPIAGEGLSAEEQDRMAEEAQKVFTDRTEWIRQIAAEKKETLEALIILTKIEDLGVPVDIEKDYYLHMMFGGSEDEGTLATQKITFKINVASTTFGICDGEKSDIFSGKTIEELKQTGYQGCAVYHNNEVHQLILEALHAGQLYQNRHNSKPAEPDRDNVQPEPAAAVATP